MNTNSNSISETNPIKKRIPKDRIILALRMRQICEPMEKISAVTGLSKEDLRINGVI